MNYFYKYNKYIIKNNNIRLLLQNGGNHIIDDQIKDIILKIFNDKKFIVLFSDDTVNVHDKENNECTKFGLSLDNIFISSLQKCSSDSGTNLLERIKKLGEELRVKYINLADVSFISVNGEHEDKCSFSLAMFNILKNGISWYNKMGFISHNFKNEVKNNETIREYNLETFLNVAVNEEHQKEISELEKEIKKYKDFVFLSNEEVNKLRKIQKTVYINVKNSIDNILTSYESIDNYYECKLVSINDKYSNNKKQNDITNKFRQLFPLVGIDEKMKNITAIFNDVLKNNIKCNDEKFKLIKEIIDLAKNIILYSANLTYEINQ